MRLLNRALLAALSIATSWALQESEAGVVDWHKKLVGVPLSGSPSTAPVFHRFAERSFVLTATENNVLAALDTKDGSVGARSTLWTSKPYSLPGPSISLETYF
jgi:hypothetical protein